MDLVWSVLGAVVDRVGVWGAAGAVLLVVILASAATDPDAFNRRAEVGFGRWALPRGPGGPGRGPVSNATWWRGGVPLPAALGDAAAPAGAGRRYRWGCWPYAARTAVLLAVVALTAPPPAAGWAEPATGSAAVLAAASTRRPAPLPLVHGPALWAVLRLPIDAGAAGAGLALRLPAEWLGGPEEGVAPTGGWTVGRTGGPSGGPGVGPEVGWP
ncbi:hypothetical protein [Streptomyces fungicidicus]|uniref:Uncharacterized protein n=1 Tax=Streptomyces fungicidicus TaxID=68203 RepID=A0ACC7Y7Z9_9ACTN|nr:hypothetical protein [Streptomyces fungicidicus]NUV77945.1 hypothetical protein [Streptomyces fungicidicus]